MAAQFVCDIRVGEFVIAICSVLLAVFAGLLWWGIHQLQDAMRSQKRDSEIIQRAYLNAYPLGIDPFDAAAYAESHVENSQCRSPAGSEGSMVHRCDHQLRQSTDALSHRGTLGNNVIYSGSEMRQWGRTAISRQEFQNFLENNIWVYVWGAIHYDDGFGNERHTNFRH